MKRLRIDYLFPLILFLALLIGQLISYLLAPGAWQIFILRVPNILSMVAFWGPIVAGIAALIVWLLLRLLGFRSLEVIRVESLEQNNPVPAIVFAGTLVAVMLFLSIVIRP
jgi:hypothetical protein